MKYTVHWHDCEDERSGNPIDVEAQTPVEAYHAGMDAIRSLSPYLQEHFCGIDIEYLADEAGKHHHPDLFLSDDLDDLLD